MRRRQVRFYPAAIVVTSISLVTTAFAAEPTKIVVGNIPSLTGAPLYIAKEKGYYAAAGLDVGIEYPGSLSDMMAMLSTNRLQAMGAGFSAAFFNLIEKKLPVTMVMSRAVSPTNHYIMLRPGLKDVIKKPEDLRGRVIGLDARGSGIMYEVDKVLVRGGLSFNDVEIKYIPLTQTPIALGSGAIDAAMLVSPIQDVAEEKKLAVRWINTDTIVQPQPMLSSVLLMNTDWIANNKPAAENFVLATLRGVRDYCNAYHHGANRAEVINYLAKYSDLKDPKAIDQIEWGSMDVDGRVFEESLSDIQDFYIRNKLIARKFTREELGPPDWVAGLAAKLGPFALEHDDGRPGCR
jgi:NitT/TauT family transport system substrate-binding protein